MPTDFALWLTLISSNYPCLELIFMVPKVFEPLNFDCINITRYAYRGSNSTIFILHPFPIGVNN